jgi:mono/diheme cytochrome c family protein
MKDDSFHKYSVATGISAALVILGMAALTVSRPATATAQFAKETGKSCGDCHTSAQGGGPLTPLGEKFKANGTKMPK